MILRPPSGQWSLMEACKAERNITSPSQCRSKYYKNVNIHSCLWRNVTPSYLPCLCYWWCCVYPPTSSWVIAIFLFNSVFETLLHFYLNTLAAKRLQKKNTWGHNLPTIDLVENSKVGHERPTSYWLSAGCMSIHILGLDSCRGTPFYNDGVGVGSDIQAFKPTWIRIRTKWDQNSVEVEGLSRKWDSIFNLKISFYTPSLTRTTRVKLPILLQFGFS